MPEGLRTETMMVGSVRGKQILEIPFLVAQAGLSTLDPVSEENARSTVGHARFHPPCIDIVFCPHEAQKGLRLFQSIKLRDCA